MVHCKKKLYRHFFAQFFLYVNCRTVKARGYLLKRIPGLLFINLHKFNHYFLQIFLVLTSHILLYLLARSLFLIISNMVSIFSASLETEVSSDSLFSVNIVKTMQLSFIHFKWPMQLWYTLSFRSWISCTSTCLYFCLKNIFRSHTTLNFEPLNFIATIWRIFWCNDWRSIFD